MHVPLTESSSAAKANTATINSGSKAGWVSLAATRFKQSVSRRRSPFLEAAARFKLDHLPAGGYRGNDRDKKAIIQWLGFEEDQDLFKESYRLR